jgi:CubicO group peptidase (beta-lactamase class C family)
VDGAPARARRLDRGFPERTAPLERGNRLCRSGAPGARLDEDAVPDRQIVNSAFVDNSDKWAGGGFVSTPEDLVAFANALLDGRLLKPETVRLLWTSQKTSDGKETEYGMGWRVDRDAKGRARVPHSGGAQGGTANLIVYPAERLVIAMVVNSDEFFTGHAPEIAEMFLDEQP